MKTNAHILAMVVCMGLVGARMVSGGDARLPTRVERLREMAEEFRVRMEREYEDAVRWAQQRGIPMWMPDGEGGASALVGLRDGKPIYYITHNAVAADTVSTDDLWPGGSMGLALDGLGVRLHVWDGGGVRETHQEFGARVEQMDAPVELLFHSTHVAGTMVAVGEDSDAHGMAGTAMLDAYEWTFDSAEMAAAAADGARVSNHSYGTRLGWQLEGDGQFAWWGQLNLSTEEDALFGFYDSAARNWDSIAHNAPYYLIVKSAGNDRDDSHRGSHRHGFATRLHTDEHGRDGGVLGYDTIGPQGCCKNVLTVGAIADIEGGYTESDDVIMAGFSSWGPTDDGRIKPDIVANGIGLRSTAETSDTAYLSISGTSMASPSVAGSLGLLIQHYRSKHGGDDMRSATLKGLVIHTADECGPNPGPDYSFGWGLLNTSRAAAHLTSGATKEDMLSSGQTVEFSWPYGGEGTLWATLSWTDPPGIPLPVLALDPPNKMLVNDLDLRVVDPSGNTYEPWILDGANPAAPATTGDNISDNMEVVRVDVPVPGDYRFIISHKGVLQGGDQAFSLLVSGIGCLDSQPVLTEFDPVSKNRYLSFEPGNGGAQTAIRVVLSASDSFGGSVGEVRWLGPPAEFPDENSDDPARMFTASALQCEPFFMDWDGVGVVHAYGALVVPGSVYDVDVVHDSCAGSLADDASYSESLTIATNKWGDVVDPFFVEGGPDQPDFTDIASLVDKFTANPAAPSKSRAQLQPNLPDPGKAIDFNDIAAVVDAFTGVDYPFEGPGSCP